MRPIPSPPRAPIAPASTDRIDCRSDARASQTSLDHEHIAIASPVRPRASADARRRQFAGARVQVGRRRTVLRAARGRRVPVRRRRQPLHRLRRLLGADDRRPQPSGGARCRAAHRARRPELRHAESAGSDDGRNHRATGAGLRNGAHGQLRHRGDAVGDPPRARRDRARAHRQVRGLLPRPRRLVPGQGRQRRADLRRADLAGRAEGARRPDADAAYNDFDARHRAVRRMRRRHRRPDRRAGRRQRQLPAAARGLPAAPARAVHAARRAADLRRGDDRLPRRAGRRAGALRRHAGPVHLRQDHRRRHAGRRLRRPPRADAADRAERPDLPGRHAQRQSGGDGRGPGDAGTGPGAGLPRRARAPHEPAVRRASKPPRAKPACR